MGFLDKLFHNKKTAEPDFSVDLDDSDAVEKLEAHQKAIASKRFNQENPGGESLEITKDDEAELKRALKLSAAQNREQDIRNYHLDPSAWSEDKVLDATDELMELEEAGHPKDVIARILEKQVAEYDALLSEMRASSLKEQLDEELFMPSDFMNSEAKTPAQFRSRVLEEFDHIRTSGRGSADSDTTRGIKTGRETSGDDTEDTDILEDERT